jgi:hypothetical protein
MNCESCGCSESRPCLDEETGEPCSWVEPGLCSACAPEDLEEVPDSMGQSPAVFPTSPSGRFPTFRPRLVA